MRFLAGLCCVATVFALPSSRAAAQIPIGGFSGTLVRIVPQQGFVVKMKDGNEVTFPANSTNPIEVRAPVDFNSLADNTPIIMKFGGFHIKEGHLETPTIYLPTPHMEQTPARIILRTDGDLDFRSVPGLLKKGPPLGFQVGQARYQIRPQGGLEIDAPPNQQNSLFKRVIPLVASDQQRGFKAEYDFGSNLLMAGKDAKVICYGGLSPHLATIHFERVEPLPKQIKK